MKPASESKSERKCTCGSPLEPGMGHEPGCGEPEPIPRADPPNPEEGECETCLNGIDSPEHDPSHTPHHAYRAVDLPAGGYRPPENECDTHVGFIPWCQSCRLVIRLRQERAALSTAIRELGRYKALDKVLLDREVEIDADERYHYPPATYQVNAPLAFIQMGWEAEMRLIKEARRALGETGR